MRKINVAVLFGGMSTEHEVSKASAHTILTNMSDEKYNIMPVYVTTQGKWLLYDGCIDNIKTVQFDKFCTEAIISPDRTDKAILRIVGNKTKRIPVDIAFPALHGLNGEDGTVQGLFELAGIPYVGCGILSSAICMDKYFMNLVASSLSIRHTEFLMYTRQDLTDIDEVTKQIRYKIGYPCFVKPANSGSSVGVGKATNKKILIECLDEAAKYDNKIMVEKAVIGRELECAVLGSGGADTEASCVGEILAGADFYDYDAKYNSNESRTVAPADIPDEVSDEIRNISVKIFKGCDCSGLARVDFFLEEGTNKVYFNEINTLPGFTTISMYPQLWNAMGVSTPELIDRLIEIGLLRGNYTP